MVNKESNARLFSYEALEQITSDGTLDDIKNYITHKCSPASPSYVTSLELLDRIRETDFVDRMIQIERDGKHSILSHSLLVCNHAAHTARQINEIFTKNQAVYIVDEPLVVTSALLHDIGKVISPTEVDGLGLSQFDISMYAEPFPQGDVRNIKTNHILKTIALFTSLGFDDHAHTAAHSTYHLINDADISLERVLLMLADFSVIGQIKEDDWPRASYVSSLTDKMVYVQQRHGASPMQYQFFLRLKVIMPLLQEAGVWFPKKDFADPDDNLTENTTSKPLAIMLEALLIQRKII